VKTSAHRREIAPYVALAGQETRAPVPISKPEINTPGGALRCLLRWSAVFGFRLHRQPTSTRFATPRCG